MTFVPYSDQLKNPQWQKRRLERLQDANWTCAMCGNKEKQLHVHHKRYVKGRMAWEYADIELSVLCNSCHDKTHAMLDVISDILVHVNLEAFFANLVGHYAVYGGIGPNTISFAKDVSEAAFLKGFVKNLTSIDSKEINDLIDKFLNNNDLYKSRVKIDKK
jgi:hypothetical protein